MKINLHQTARNNYHERHVPIPYVVPGEGLTAGKHDQLNRRIFIGAAIGGVLRCGTVRDFHNDEPKPVACATDMLLPAVTASGRLQIGHEQQLQNNAFRPY